MAPAIIPIILLLSFWQVSASEQRDCEAAVFVLQDLEQERSIASPNGRNTVTVGVKSEDDGEGWMRVRSVKGSVKSFKLLDLSGGVFVKWAPDSRAFYIMWSNGGAIGAYRLRVFRVLDHEIRELPTALQAERDFERRYPCEARGHNTFAIEWKLASAQILLAEQVYPTGDCGRRAGLYGGYLVRVDDGVILLRYTEPELKRVWPQGCPGTVYPSGLWGSDDLKKAQEERRRAGGN